MKIAISGAANTGKTTLAKDLSKETGLPLIEERFGDLRPKRIEDKNAGWIAEAFLKVDRAKQELEQTFHKGFITDRCTIDLFNFWTYTPFLVNRAETQKLYEKWKTHSTTYDYIIFLSWGSVAYRENESGESRLVKVQMNPWNNLRRHTSTLGLAYSWADSRKIIVVPKHVIERKERVDWVLKTLTERKQ